MEGLQTATAAPGNGGGGMSVSLKDQGNEFFKAGNYLKAAALYTQAIKQDPKNPTLYRGHYIELVSFILNLKAEGSGGGQWSLSWAHGMAGDHSCVD